MKIHNVKENLSDPVISRLLAPSVYHPTPERLLSRAKEYQHNDTNQSYACAEAGDYQVEFYQKCGFSVADT